jgi:anti-sigma-K factor RskA
MMAAGPGHEGWADAAGAYVLGALAPEEADAYAEHLAGCEACRVEVEDLAPGVAALPASVAPVAVPAGLRERVMAEVRRDAELLAAVRDGTQRKQPAPARPRRRLSWLRRPLPALVAAAVLIALVAALVLGGGGEPSVQMAASGPARGAHAVLVLGDEHATLEAHGLPAPPRGHVYQVWLKPKGRPPQPSALFVPRADGSVTVDVPPARADLEAVMVSAEPLGGSTAPTSAPVLVANLS